MRLFSHGSFDQLEFQALLSRHAELRDQLTIGASALEQVEVDTSPMGNTDPDVLLRNLAQLMANFATYRHKFRWLRVAMDDRLSVFFDCHVGGTACRSYEQLEWIQRKLEQDSRRKKLAIGFSDFFRKMDISVGKDNAEKFVRLAEEFSRNHLHDSPRIPRPAARPNRSLRIKANQVKAS